MEAQATLDVLMDRVHAIEPVLRKYSTQSETQRFLAPEAVVAMRNQGLFRLWKPGEFGGLEVDPMTAFRVFEEVARIDSAAGWNLQLTAGAEVFGAWFSDEDARETFDDPEGILAGAFFPPRRAVAVEGGYIVSGRTPFASGVHQATCVLGLAHVYDGDAPRLGTGNQPITLITACPVTQVHIIDTWNTLGMRGTGSHDVLMENVFVPSSRTAPLIPRTRSAAAYGGPLYRYTAWGAIAALSTVGLGIARAAMDELKILAGRKSPSYTQRTLKDSSSVQASLGRAEALVGAARAYLHEALRDVWDQACEGRYIDLPGKIKLQLAASHAAQSAMRAVDLVQSAVGSTGFRLEYSFERHFRDVHTIVQHAYIASARFESVGQLLLEAPVEWPFYPL